MITPVASTSNEENYTISNNSTSPILKRTSGFYDHNYDSISEAFSESTVADSDYIAQRIREYEKERRLNEAVNENAGKPTVYNVHIDKVVIDNANSKKNVNYDEPVKAAVTEIMTNFDKMPSSFSKEKPSKFHFTILAIKNPKLYVPLSLLLIVLIALSISMPIIFKKKNEFPIDTTEKTTETADDTTPNFIISTVPSTSTQPEITTQTLDPTSSIQTEPTTAQTEPTTAQTEPTTPQTEQTEPTTPQTEPTTLQTEPPEPPFDMKLVKREKWLEEGLPIVGKYKQLLPIPKVIVMDTEMDDCETEESCIEVLVDRQQMDYPDYDDIRENFVIARDGTVYEGRGFLREGQTTYDDLETSYNNNAITISFIASDLIEAKNKQLEVFCYFLKSSIDNGSLSENFSMFLHTKIVSNVETSNLADLVDCYQFKSVPNIIRQSEWQIQPVEPPVGFKRKFSKKVIVASGGSSCDSREKCVNLLKTLRESDVVAFGEIYYNFIFGGNDLIFEGRSFDLASPDFYDSITILFLGDYMVNAPPTSLIESFKEFLQFSMDVGKLTKDFKLYGERQLNGNESSPGDELFTILKNEKPFSDHFDNSIQL